jgi:hypothetical protein
MRKAGGGQWTSSAQMRSARSWSLARLPTVTLGPLLPPPPAGELEACTSLVYALLTGHPERETGELVLWADLTGELRSWPQSTWTAVGVDPG